MVKLLTMIDKPPIMIAKLLFSQICTTFQFKILLVFFNRITQLSFITITVIKKAQIFNNC